MGWGGGECVQEISQKWRDAKHPLWFCVNRCERVYCYSPFFHPLRFPDLGKRVREKEKNKKKNTNLVLGCSGKRDEIKQRGGGNVQ